MVTKCLPTVKARFVPYQVRFKGRAVIHNQVKEIGLCVNGDKSEIQGIGALKRDVGSSVCVQE